MFSNTQPESSASEEKTRREVRLDKTSSRFKLIYLTLYNIGLQKITFVSQCLAANLVTISQSRALHILIVSKAMSTVFEPFDGLIRESTEKRLYEMNSRT